MSERGEMCMRVCIFTCREERAKVNVFVCVGIHLLIIAEKGAKVNVFCVCVFTRSFTSERAAITVCVCMCVCVCVCVCV